MTRSSFVDNKRFLKAMQDAGLVADANQVISATIHVSGEYGVPQVWVQLIPGAALVDVVASLDPKVTVTPVSPDASNGREDDAEPAALSPDGVSLRCPRCGNGDPERFMSVIRPSGPVERCWNCGTDTVFP